MPKYNLKYRPFFILISLFYANFLFLSPLFHHHHELSEVTKAVIHSHLINDISDDKHADKSDHHLESGRDHTNIFNSSSLTTVIPTKNLPIKFVVDFYTISIFQIENQKIESIKLPIYDFASELRMGKYVHTAANVSPPLA